MYKYKVRRRKLIGINTERYYKATKLILYTVGDTNLYKNKCCIGLQIITLITVCP